MRNLKQTLTLDEFAKAVKARPELKKLNSPEVSILVRPGFRDDMDITLAIEWWQGGRKEDCSVIYPEPDWVDGIDGLLSDLLKRAVGKHDLFFRNTGAE